MSNSAVAKEEEEEEEEDLGVGGKLHNRLYRPKQGLQRVCHHLQTASSVNLFVLDKTRGNMEL